jgi:Tol biopolymer transport system component
VPFVLRPFGRDEHDPNYSPDGKQITYSKQTGECDDVFTMGADGSHLAPADHERRVQGRSAYSPSGRKIVYVRDTRKGTNLYGMDADGSGKHALTEATKVEHVSPDWGPKP